MKKIFTILCGMLLATGAFAELGYNATFTQNDFNSSSTVVKKSGTIEWDGGAVRCGGSSTSIAGGPAWNWDEKSFDVHLANGVPAKLSFQYKGNAGGSTGVTFKVQESANGSDWTEVWSTTSNTTSYKSISKDLQLSTRYLRFSFAGNFAGLFKDIKVTEKILMGTPNPTSLDFGTVKVDDKASMSFTLGWTNLTATVTGSTEQFTVTPESFGQIGAYTQTATISVALNTSAAGEYSTTVHVEGRGKSADVPVMAKVEKYDQTINWDAVASYNYGEAIPVAVATSGLDVDYEISDASVLKFENGAFVALHGGDVTITAKQAGNYKYNAAANVVKTITIVPPTTYSDFEETTCGEPVEFNNQTYEESFADDVNVGENYLGGDSIVHVNIVINHATFGTDEMTIVYGDEVEWNGIDLSEYTVGSHEVEFKTTNVAGCDSTVTLTLTVNKIETLEVPVDLSFCAGGSEWYREVEYSEAGVFDVPVEGATRDTLYKVNVTVLQPSFVEEDMTIIVGTDTAWNGIALKDSTVGVHYVVFDTTNVAGCDSTVTLTLTVNKIETLEVPVDLSFCAGGSEWYREVEYSEAGVFDVPVEGATRDTVYKVNVVVLQPSSEAVELEMTVGDDLEWNGIALKDSTVGAHSVVAVLTNAAGCDSTVTLTLTVNKIETIELPVDLAFCAGGSEWYRGTEYAEAGVYDVPVEGETRDTVYMVNVTVLQPSFDTAEMEITVGDEVEWNGIALKDSTVGVHYVEFVTTNVAGCDSTVTLTLTVNKLEMLETEYQIEICEGSEQTYRGVIYNEEGMFTLDVIEGETRDTLLTVVVTVNAKGYEEILLTDTIGNTIELPEGEWTLGDDVVSGSYEIQETDIEGLVFVQIGETEKGCEAVTKIIVTVEEKPQDQGDPTGFETIEGAQQAVKEFRNGVLYIRRGEKVYTASGELVK